MRKHGRESLWRLIYRLAAGTVGPESVLAVAATERILELHFTGIGASTWIPNEHECACLLTWLEIPAELGDR
jgi:hypothetical protein